MSGSILVGPALLHLSVKDKKGQAISLVPGQNIIEDDDTYRAICDASQVKRWAESGRLTLVTPRPADPGIGAPIQPVAPPQAPQATGVTPPAGSLFGPAGSPLGGGQ